MTALLHKAAAAGNDVAGMDAGVRGGDRVSSLGTLPRYVEMVGSVRAMVEDGTLLPGAPGPSAASLARNFGCKEWAGRKALRLLIADGVLVRGATRNARPRVPSAVSPGEQARASAARALSAALARLRTAAGLTQGELAAAAGFSLTAVGHAETGRLWQSRRFWEQADKALDAGGELPRLYDALRATAGPPGPCPGPQPPP
jgi:hypothetical protein